MKRDFKKILYMAIILLVCAGIEFLFSSMKNVTAADDGGMTCPYILQISTGASDGSEIGAIRILYSDLDGNSHSQYVMPTDGDLQKSLIAANKYGGDNAKIKAAKTVSNQEFYSWENFDVKGLSANSTDTYLVDFYYRVKTIDEIQIIPVSTSKQVDWQCLGIRLYEVSWGAGKWDIFGVGMRGYLSDSYYIRFAGHLRYAVCNRASKKLNIVFNSSGNTRAFVIRKEGANGEYNAYLVDSGFDEKDLDYSTDDGSVYQFKVDFADVVGAGIESYSNGYGTEKKSLDEYKLPESLMATISYTDKYGSSVQIRMPVITSFLTSLKLNGCVNESDMSKKYLVDIAGQGESLVYPMYLPDCEAVNYVKFDYGVDDLHSKFNWTTVTGADTKYSEQIKAKMKKNEDSISITSCCVMEKQYAKGHNVYEQNVPYMRFANQASLVADEAAYPVRWYYNSNSGDGIVMELNYSASSYAMRPYTSNASLRPSQNGNYFLFAFETDNVALASSSSDILVRVQYRATSGKLVETKEMHLSELAENFYGYWPDSKGNNVAALAGMQAGKTVYGILKIECVESFEGIVFKMNSGNDDWQMSKVQIFQISEMSSRMGYWLDSNKTIGTNYIDRTYSRIVNRTMIYDSALFDKQPTEETPEISPEDSSCILNIETQINVGKTEAGTKVTFSGEVKREPAFEWLTEYHDAMSYDITRKNLGFNTTAVKYKVQVQVYGDADDGTGNGDCGSANLFYFQLIFSDGKSAFVEANQQLSGDCFHTGALEQFYIDVNKDYGNLRAIRVLPDATQENSNIYDKLKIKYIKVSYDEVNGTNNDHTGITNDYTFDINEWIGFDRDDDAEAFKNKTMDEISRIYYMTSVDKGVKCEFELVMENESELTDNNLQPFVGAVQATIYYTNDSGFSTYTNFDLVQAIYEYRNTSVSKAKINGKDKAVSEKSSMFRPGHTDRFYVSIPNLQTLECITFTCVDPNATSLFHIKGIKVNRISSTEKVIINQNDEYELDCERFRVAYNVGFINNYYNDEDSRIPALVCTKDQDRSTQQIFFVQEFADAFKYASNGNWEYRIYEGEDDANQNGEEEWLNVYVKLNKSGQGYSTAGQIQHCGSYDKKYKFEIYYKNSDGTYFQNVSDDYEEVRVDNSTVELTCLRIPIKGKLETLMSISAMGCPDPAGCDGLVNWKVDSFYVQHIKDGVVLYTYKCTTTPTESYIDSIASLVSRRFYTADPSSMPYNQVGNSAVIYASLGDMTDGIKLTNKTKDIAFKVYYKKKLFGNTEIKSQYIYLTDYLGADGELTFKDHQYFEIPIKDISPNEIVSIDVVATGGLTAKLDGLAIGLYEDSSMKKLDKWYSFSDKDGIEVTNTSKNFKPVSKKMDEDSTLVPVEIQLTTANKDIFGGLTGTEYPIEMIINYLDKDGEVQSKKYEDITPYVASGNFTSGSTAIIKLLEPGMNNIQSVRLRPYDQDSNMEVSWVLESMKIIYGKVAAQGDEKVKINNDPVVVNKKITEDKGLTVSAYNMNIKYTEVKTGTHTVNPEETDEINVDPESLKVELGYKVDYPARYDSTDATVDIKVYMVEGNVSTDVTDIMEKFEVTEDSITIIFPKATEDVTYNLVISGTENFSDFKQQITLKVPKTVEPEEEPSENLSENPATKPEDSTEITPDKQSGANPSGDSEETSAN